MDPDTGKALGLHGKTFKTYLGSIAQEKVDALLENRSLTLIVEDIQHRF